jgi:hypothetical protein
LLGHNFILSLESTHFFSLQIYIRYEGKKGGILTQIRKWLVPQVKRVVSIKKPKFEYYKKKKRKKIVEIQVI